LVTLFFGKLISGRIENEMLKNYLWRISEELPFPRIFFKKSLINLFFLKLSQVQNPWLLGSGHWTAFTPSGENFDGNTDCRERHPAASTIVTGNVSLQPNHQNRNSQLCALCSHMINWGRM